MSDLKQAIINEAVKNSGVTFVHCKVEYINMCLYKGWHSIIDAQGAYDHNENTLYLNLAISDEQSLAVFLHELAHATAKFGATNRRAGFIVSKLFIEAYSCEEIIAEAVSQMLLHHFGINTEATDARSAKYISRHKEQAGDNLEVLDCHINEAFNYILNNWLPNSSKLKRTA